MKWLVHWIYTSGYEQSRKEVIEADNKQAAIKVLGKRHLESGSALRSEIEVLRIEPLLHHAVIQRKRVRMV